MSLAIQEYFNQSFSALRGGVSLKARIARATVWLGLGNGMEHGMRFLRNMLLAKYFLPPGAFGLMALVMAINMAFESLTQIGIKESVIQAEKGNDPRYLNGAWWLAFTRGLVLYAIAFSIAPFIADFYHKPHLLSLLRVGFLTLIFNGAMSPHSYAALKQMQYRDWAMIIHGGSLCGIVTAIICGVIMRNPWALVIGFTVEYAAQCVLSHIVRPFRPTLQFDREILAPLFQYTRRLAGLPILAFLYSRADVFVLGKLIKSEQLGLYTMAYSLAVIPSLICTTFVTPILMPALSSMQDDREKMVSAILRTTRYLALVFLPLLTFLACGAPFILSLAYGQQYASVSGVFAVFCATVGLNIVAWSVTTTFFAIGRPDMIRWASVLRLAVMLSLILPLIHRWGLHGAAFSGLVSSLVLVVYSLIRLKYAIGLSISRFIGSVSMGVAAAAGVCGVCLIALHLLNP